MRNPSYLIGKPIFRMSSIVAHGNVILQKGWFRKLKFGMKFGIQSNIIHRHTD
uniref:Uncharacterized protein n=1 Tax=Nelumbo nucifera TaxID=4432 RepID=A0A822ZRX4_NELNU|nr:TPA_asm: hypothetical protein HUJ06_004531 [Nelumbo nucifera]